MIQSLRRPSRFHIQNFEECSEASSLNKIVRHFATHVRKLRFGQRRKKISLADFEFIMRSMINVEEVTLNELCIDGHHKKLANNLIEMPMLKKLILTDFHDESVDVISRVKAKLLEELYVQGQTEVVLNFEQFFKNHKTIKTISMSGKLLNPEAFLHLQLSKLQVYNGGNSDGNRMYLRDVIAYQPKLKHLDLLSDQGVPFDYWFDEDENPNVSVNDDLFAVICGLKELESLKIVIGQVTPHAIGKIANLTNLKELVLNAAGDDIDFDNDYDYDVNEMRTDVQFQKCFRKLIATPLPKLESFTWSSKVCEVDNEYWMSEDEEMMEHAREREYSSLGKVNIIATMAPSFPLLKFLKIEMKTNDASDINVRDILKQFSHLDTLQLKTSSSFKGGQSSKHEHIKHVKINEIEKNFLIEMLESMPNLESLEIRDTQFSLDKSFLQNLQASIPDRLKKIKLKFNSQRREDFALENVVILQDIIKKLQKCEVKLTGNCNFDSLAEKVDRSVNVSLPRSPKWYIPGDADDFESYMQLWK